MNAVTALMSGLVDYAGLFPPAGLAMREALANYSDYLSGPDSAALGRFIVPVAGLDEFQSAFAALYECGRGASRWRLSVLSGPDVGEAVERSLLFNANYPAGDGGSRADIDAIEIKADGADSIAAAAARVPRTLTAYFETPLDDQLPAAIDAIRRANARAKIRTGGVTADAIPASSRVLDFLKLCRGAGVPFKATAGLHHPVRSEYPLTYEPNADKGEMLGFLNLFLAAAYLHSEPDGDSVRGILDETDSSAFQFGEGGIVWRGTRITTEAIRASRESFAISFGSCSFREPVDELNALMNAGAAA